MSSDTGPATGTAQPADYERILQAVRKIVATHLQLDLDQAQPETRLLDLPGADSLKLLQGVVEIEDTFGVTVDPDRGAAVQTVAEVADLVYQAVRDSGRSAA